MNPAWFPTGYLMNTYTERHEGFSQLLTDITELGEGSAVPCLADKVKVMLSGQWDGHQVLARGNARMPGKALTRKLTTVLGEEVSVQTNKHQHINNDNNNNEL